MPFPCPFCSLAVEQAESPVNAVCPRCGGFFLLPAEGGAAGDFDWRRNIAWQLGIVLIVAACSWFIT